MFFSIRAALSGNSRRTRVTRRRDEIRSQISAGIQKSQMASNEAIDGRILHLPVAEIACDARARDLNSV